MSNLVPEKRIDKNGRAVTRRVKMPAPPAGSSVFASLNLNLESPLKAGQGEASTLLLETLFTQSSTDPKIYLQPDGSEASAGLIMLLGAIPAESLNAVSERAASLTAKERGIVSETLSEIDRRYVSLMNQPEYVEGMLHYSAELAPYIVTYSAGEPDALDMHSAAMHIHSQIASAFRGREPRLMFADEAEKEVVRGATVNYMLTDAYFDNKNVLTLSWFGKNLDRIEGYKEVIRARGTMDRKLIDELMESDTHRSLTGGYL